MLRSIPVVLSAREKQLCNCSLLEGFAIAEEFRGRTLTGVGHADRDAAQLHVHGCDCMTAAYMC